MAQETISLSSPTEGPWARTFSDPLFGQWDQLRNQEAMYPGQAIAFKNSALAADNRSIYVYGNASARAEFGGVCTTYSTSPGNLNAISTTNSDTVSALKAGYMAVMMAPGQVVRRDQYLEPISSGTYRGLWKVATGNSGPAQALQAFDDSANVDGAVPGRMCSAFIFPQAAAGAGVIAAVGPSDVLTGTTSETAYKLATVPLALPLLANSVKVGSRLKCVFAITAQNGASGATVFKAYLQSAAGVPTAASKFYESISSTPGAGDVVQVSAEFYVSALSGSNNVFLEGTATVGTPGTATARSLGVSCTIDPTVTNYLTITCTPNNNADQSLLQFVSYEKVG